MVTTSKNLYPFGRHVHEVDTGHKMSFLNEGKREGGKPSVLMLHGNPTWSFMYREVLKALRDSKHCIVPDHIGCGYSDKPSLNDYGYTLSSRLEDVDSLVAQTMLDEPIDLILHDWGGMIGLAWAVQHPERIRRIVLINTGAFEMPRDAVLSWQLKLARSPLGKTLIQGFNAFAWGAAKSCAERGLSKEVEAMLVSPYNSWSNRVATYEFVRDIPFGPQDASYALMKETESKLHLLKDKPVLLLWGMKDFVFDRAFYNRFVEIFPHAEKHAFENAGHYLLEDETESCVDHIKGFLA